MPGHQTCSRGAVADATSYFVKRLGEARVGGARLPRLGAGRLGGARLGERGGRSGGAEDGKKYRITREQGQPGSRGDEVGWWVWRSVARGDTQPRAASHQARSGGLGGPWAGATPKSWAAESGQAGAQLRRGRSHQPPHPRRGSTRRVPAGGQPGPARGQEPASADFALQVPGKSAARVASPIPGPRFFMSMSPESTLNNQVSQELKKLASADIDKAVEFMGLHEEEGDKVVWPGKKAKMCPLAPAQDPASAPRAHGCELCTSGPACAAARHWSRP